jgi:hypothetical protein
MVSSAVAVISELFGKETTPFNPRKSQFQGLDLIAECDLIADPIDSESARAGGAFDAAA